MDESSNKEDSTVPTTMSSCCHKGTCSGSKNSTMTTNSEELTTHHHGTSTDHHGHDHNHNNHNHTEHHNHDHGHGHEHSNHDNGKPHDVVKEGVATTEKKACSASKEGGCSSKQNKKSCSSSDNGHNHSHNHGHSHSHHHNENHQGTATTAAPVAGKGGCCANKSCGSSSTTKVAATENTTGNKSACCNSSSCGSNQKKVANEVAVKPQTHANGCCDSKSCGSKKTTNKAVPEEKGKNSGWFRGLLSGKKEAPAPTTKTNSHGEACKKGCCPDPKPNDAAPPKVSDCCKGGSCSKTTTAEVPKKPSCGGGSGHHHDHNPHDHHHSHDHNNSTEVQPKSTSACCSKPHCGANAAAAAKVHSHHSHNKAGHHHDSSPRLCVAVVQENGTDVVVFDTNGVARTFHFEFPPAAVNGQQSQQLCFHSHGNDYDYLTPCFDENGAHGNPADPCFCGVQTAHLHAHLKNAAICNKPAANTSTNDAASAFLASQILYPIDSTTSPKVDGTDKELFTFSVSESMPNECNSHELSKHTNKSTASSTHCRRLGSVKHDDHVDYLVHNPLTGQLHLEHPCTSCGHDDVHGRFRTVGKRRIRQRSEPRDIQVHFFEMETKPFTILDYLSDLFDVNSDRVTTIENMLLKMDGCRHCSQDPFAADHSNHSRGGVDAVYVRSNIVCSRICCASEIPIVQGILSPVRGVKKVLVNAPMKVVSVEHDPSVVTATELVNKLNWEKMGASLQRDGAANMARPPNGSSADGRSQFHVQNICCASEIPAINKVLVPTAGVFNVKINTTTKMVYVDHNFNEVSAQALGDALAHAGFEATIKVDAAAAANSGETTGSFFVTSTLVWNLDHPAVVNETIVTVLRSLSTPNQIETFSVNMEERSITVKHNPLLITIVTVAKELEGAAGLVTIVSRDGSDPAVWKFPIASDKDSNHDDALQESRKDENRFTYPRPTVIISGLLWFISLLSLLGGNFEYLKYVAIVSIAFGIPTIAMKAFRTLRRFQFDTNCLMTFAALGALALQDFEEAAAVVFLFALSEWLEVRATTRARRALSAIVQLRPEKANIIHPFTKELIVVPAESIPVGVLVSVRAGDKVPCDGVVVEGISTVDESSLTGESRPIKKSPQDIVSGGTVNSGRSPLTIRTTATSDNSAVSRLIRLVEEAQTNRSETEVMVDRFAKIYTPIIVAAAVLMCSISWAFGPEAGRTWTFNGLVLIVVACPCALIISTPVAYVAGLAASAQHGVLIKGGAYLESLAKVKFICFDKTGTLTNGIFSLLHMNVLSPTLSREEVFQYLVLMEERASHPIAQAILAAAENERVSVPKTMILENHTIIEGEGVTGVINGLVVYVGNERLFERLEVLDKVSSSDRQIVDGWKSLGGTIGFMSIDGYGIVCAFCAADGIRSESKKVVAALRQQLGISVCMLTGDNSDAAEAIGRQVGLSGTEVRSKLLPEEKLNYIKDLVDYGRTGRSSSDNISSMGLKNRGQSMFSFKKTQLVMMCGDGVNDAPALAASDVGVAMGAGASLAMESADITLLDSNLEKLEFSIRLGRLVTSKIVQNVVFSLVTKLIVVGFALSGRTKLWAAICADVGSMLVVTLNAMTIIPRKQTAPILEETGRSVVDNAVKEKDDVESGDSSDGTQPPN